MRQQTLWAVLGGWLFVAPANAATTYVEDFSKPSTAWRYGNRICTENPGPLVFGRGSRDATLSGTVVNPKNMSAFSADVRFQFGESVSPMLVMGWGKPYEWDGIKACPGKLWIEHTGRFRVDVGGKIVGSGTLVADASGNLTAHLEMRQKEIAVNGQEFSLEGGATVQPGYWMFFAEGMDPLHGETICRVMRFELHAKGDQPAMSEEESRKNCDEWARAHIRDNDRMLDALEAAVEKDKAAGKWGYAEDMSVEPQLVRTGEPVTIRFSVKGAAPANSEAWVVPDYLGKHPGKKEKLNLKWESSSTDAPLREAVVKLVPDRPGNMFVGWKVGNETLSRMLGVVGDGYAVYRYQYTSPVRPLWDANVMPKDTGGKPYPDPQSYEIIHKYGLAADYWSGGWTEGRYFVFPPEKTIQFSNVLRKIAHQWGDTAAPSCNADWMLPDSPDRNLFRVPPDVQRVGLKQAQRCWELLDLGPLSLLDTYTQGNETPRVAREVGVKALDSMCQWQNWRDGGMMSGNNGWLINDVGAPPFPYYVADDDFRKVAPGKSIVQLTQGTTSSVRLFTIYTMEGCPTNAFICNDNPYGEKMIAAGAQAKNEDRFEAAADAWTEEAAYQKEPLFLSVSLQNFVERADWNRANCMAIEHLRDEARKHKIVFTQGEGIAEYFQNHYSHQPENWIYWPDAYAGLAEDYKPDQLADHIELSNVEFHIDSWDGEALPRFFWDYTQPWSNPEWDPAKGVRNMKTGLIPPDKITADTVPHMVHLDGVKAKVEMKPGDDGAVTVKVSIDSPKAYAFLPVAVWRIPLSGKGLKSHGPENGRFIPIIDGSTDNLAGIAVCRDVKAGHGEWSYTLKGRARAFVDPDIRVGKEVAGRVFIRDGVPHAYLWLANGENDGTVSIKAPAERHVTVHYNDGTGAEVTGGSVDVRLGKDWMNKSPMVTGMNAAELEAGATWKGGG
jgi:hypothetical protein